MAPGHNGPFKVYLSEELIRAWYQTPPDITQNVQAVSAIAFHTEAKRREI